ncbi:MAG: hypothetical protein ACR9NN_12770 [Nostochopsis sp.]
MRVWLVCFVVLFALAQLFDWIKGLQLPLPIYILGGAFLAIASNYDKLFGTYFSNVTDASMEASVEQVQLDSQVEATGSMISPASQD